MNKFDLINATTVSDLSAQDKSLLIELIMRADDAGVCWPSVQRLCMARGIKHEKNFKGADVYLAGLVTKSKRGRKNTYHLNPEAILALGRQEVVIKHTPAATGSNTPAATVAVPAPADNSPDAEGANSTSNNTTNISKNITREAAPPLLNNPYERSFSHSSLRKRNCGDLLDRTSHPAPSLEGVWSDRSNSIETGSRATPAAANDGDGW